MVISLQEFPFKLKTDEEEAFVVLTIEDPLVLSPADPVDVLCSAA